MDLQVDGKYRLGKKIGSGMALLPTRLMDLKVDGKYRLGKKIGSGMAPLTDSTDGHAS